MIEAFLSEAVLTPRLVLDMVIAHTLEPDNGTQRAGGPDGTIGSWLDAGSSR